MRSNDRPNRTARLTLAAVATATLALAGCSSGGDWPTAGGVSAAPTTSAAAAPSTSPSDAASPGDGGSGTTGTPVAGGQNGGNGGTGNGGGNSGGNGGGEQGGSARCTTGELKGSLGPADAGAGSVNQSLILTNVGSRTCYLRGFPGVSYVGGDNGAQVGPAASMGGPRGGDIRLAVGGAAEAPMRLTNVENFPAADCKPVPVRGLRIYPPGDTASLFVPREGTGCSVAPPGGDQLSVRTLAAR